MIKYILYWALYTSSLSPEPKNVVGTMIIYEDSVRFYTQDAGYRTWPIVAKHVPYVRNGYTPGYGMYLLKNDDTYVTILLHHTYIEYTVKHCVSCPETDVDSEYIRVKRRYPIPEYEKD